MLGLALGSLQAIPAPAPPLDSAVHPASPHPLAFDPLAPLPDPALYRPNGEWIGRLILPTISEVEDQDQEPDDDTGDWVWIELQQVPADQLRWRGERLRLRWQSRPELDALVRAVTTDVSFTAAARRSIAQGNVLPVRLDGRRQVGPLQSLAAARPSDDVLVTFESVELVQGPDGPPSLRIATPPVQISGRYLALVQLLGPAGGGDRFRVQHYEPRSGGFTGPLETVRIPRQAPDRDGRLPFNPQGLAGSAAGREGWYLYGAPDATGLFTAEALLPRQLFQIQPDSSVAGQSAGLRYLLHRNWKHTPERRGQLERVQLGAGTTARRWRLGDRGLLIHNFGGIGGRRGEPISGFTVTGHFAFGAVEVVPDPFSGEPRFEIRYHQIYANNPNGIIAGTQAASAYAGDLQRGWLWLRPISDVLIQQELFAGLNLGDRHFSLLDELALQAEVIMARYRSGDGTGLSSVTPATSCVQDSNQALFIAIRRLREKVQADSDLRDWLRRHPRHLETRKFRQLGQLADSLDQLLSPFGMVRSDWRSNAAIVAAAETGSATETAPTTGTAPPATPLFQRGEGLGVGLLSWRSMLPRRGHDDTARVFLQSGADLWFLRTNQLPGLDPSLEPLAPTLLFGQLPLVSILLRRTADALFTPLVGSAALVSGLVLLVYAGTALVIGERSGFLPRVGRRQSWRAPPVAAWLFPVAGLLVRPALLEEVFFRVALLPHPLEGAGIFSSLAWGALSVGLFVAYHPLAAATWYPRGRSLFWDPRFLSQCALLGVACVLAYDLTSSLWAPVLIHWLAVSLWLWPLGGRHRLAG